MNDIPRIPWANVFSNFVWILGAAVILADFSYHEFLAHMEKVKWIDVFKRNSFKRPLHLGLILVAAGISASIHSPLLAATSVCVAFFLIIWFIRQAKKK